MPACSQPGSGDCLPWAPAGRLSLTSCWVTCYENIGEVHLPDLLEAPFWWFVLRTVLLSPAWGSGVLDGNILRLKEFGFFPDGGCYPASLASTSLCKAGSNVCSLPQPMLPVCNTLVGLALPVCWRRSQRVPLTVHTCRVAVTSMRLSLRVMLSTACWVKHVSHCHSLLHQLDIQLHPPCAGLASAVLKLLLSSSLKVPVPSL